jgi:pimeloyl-ACP methyl ester carboxylesterase
MPFIDINDIRMYYEESGQGAPLVLLHGGTSTIDADGGWSSVRPLLAGQFHAIFIGHRGHGRTNNPTDQITYEQIADDLAALLDRLEIAPAHIAGMSDGGIAALQLGMTRPDLARTLTCVGANYTVDERIKETIAPLVPASIEREHPDWVADLVRRHDVHRGPGYWRTLVQQVMHNAATSPSYTVEDLQRISTPTLLIAGENDPFGNLDQMVTMRRNIPHSELLIINNAGHIVQHTHPHLVGPAIVEFLERHPGPDQAARK